MVSKSEVWTLEKDLCRCCHAEGAFINLATANTFRNREEIYSDMLRACFDIEISPVPGGLCNPTYTICSVCVDKLQEASTFKEQVLKCEEKFYTLLTTTSITVATSFKKEHDITIQEFNVDMADDLHDSVDDIDFKSEPGENVIEDAPPKCKILRHRLTQKEPVKQAVRKRKATPKAKAQKKSPKVVKNEDKKEIEKKGLSQSEEQYCTVRQEDDATLTYTCNTCSNTYKRRDSIKQHYRHVHLKQRPRLHGCYFCPERVRAYLRAQHMEEAHGIPAPTCGACGKKFSFPFQVVKHQKTFHMGEKNFTCPVCDMSFGSKPNLRQHVIKHTTERPFKCDSCDEAFKWKKHLRRHMAGHLQKKR